MTAYFVFSFSSDPDTAPHNSTTEQAMRNNNKVLPATGTVLNMYVPSGNLYSNRIVGIDNLEV